MTRRLLLEVELPEMNDAQRLAWELRDVCALAAEAYYDQFCRRPSDAAPTSVGHETSYGQSRVRVSERLAPLAASGRMTPERRAALREVAARTPSHTIGMGAVAVIVDGLREALLELDRRDAEEADAAGVMRAARAMLDEQGAALAELRVQVDRAVELAREAAAIADRSLSGRSLVAVPGAIGQGGPGGWFECEGSVPGRVVSRAHRFEEGDYVSVCGMFGRTQVLGPEEPNREHMRCPRCRIDLEPEENPR